MEGYIFCFLISYPIEFLRISRLTSPLVWQDGANIKCLPNTAYTWKLHLLLFVYFCNCVVPMQSVTITNSQTMHLLLFNQYINLILTTYECTYIKNILATKMFETRHGISCNDEHIAIQTFGILWQILFNSNVNFHPS